MNKIIIFYKAPVKTYLQPCLTTIGLYDNTSCSSAQNIYCARTGQMAGYCVCPNLYYFDTATSKCIPQKFGGIACYNTSHCRADLGLTCQSGYCSCLSNMYWDTIYWICSKLLLFK